GIKTKVYYTVREQTIYTPEFWALRSLGTEIFVDGLGSLFSSGSWLTEHVMEKYQPAWHQPLAEGEFESSIATAGLSRWHNYFLEGINWLAQNIGIDGCYLDGIGYDREIAKRARKVMLRANPNALFDFHNGNNYLGCGLNNAMCHHAEHLPFIDTLWFGEYFDYNESPDYWMTEISGIPFGVFGELVLNGQPDNPWRGMIYGAATRLYCSDVPWDICTRGLPPKPLSYSDDPRKIWQLWDQFGIEDATLIGYWDEACPVRTGQTNILATAYVRSGKTLIVLASWAPTTVNVQLTIDQAAVGLDLQHARLSAPAIPGVQTATTFQPDASIPVAPGRGWFLVLEPDE